MAPSYPWLAAITALTALNGCDSTPHDPTDAVAQTRDALVEAAHERHQATGVAPVPAPGERTQDDIDAGRFTWADGTTTHIAPHTHAATLGTGTRAGAFYFTVCVNSTHTNAWATYSDATGEPTREAGTGQGACA